MSVVIAAVGAGIFLLLGVGHWVLTMQSSMNGGPMMPTNPETRDAMSTPGGLGLAPELESTLFKAWIGFNYSHAFGVITIAAIVLFHVLDDLGAALDQLWFAALVVFAPPLYLVLAQRYWFNQPRDAIALGTFLLWIGVLVEVL